MKTNSARSKPLLIEFFGVPGCGKSTVCDDLLPMGTFLGRPEVAERWSAMPLHQRLPVGLGALTDIFLAQSAFVMATKIRIARFDPANRLLRLCTKGKLLQSITEPLVFDQGSLQGLWSICFGSGCFSPDPGPISNFLNRLWNGKRVSIIVLDVPAGVAAERVAKRRDGDSRLEELAQHEIAEKLRLSETLPSSLVAAAKAAGAETIVIDGTRPPDEVARECRKAIAAIAG